MMRRTIAVAVLLTAIVLAASAQSLLDDPNYKALIDQVKQLQADAQAAINDGDYDKAVELADQAEEVALEAEEYAEQRVLGYRANGWINLAKERIVYADSVSAKDRYPEEYELATSHLADAEEAARLQQEADDFAAAAGQANQNSDDYVLTAVAFALVLFFSGVSSKLSKRGNRNLAVIIGTVIFVGATWVLLTLPKIMPF